MGSPPTPSVVLPLVPSSDLDLPAASSSGVVSAAGAADDAMDAPPAAADPATAAI